MNAYGVSPLAEPPNPGIEGNVEEALVSVTPGVVVERSPLRSMVAAPPKLISCVTMDAVSPGSRNPSPSPTLSDVVTVPSSRKGMGVAWTKLSVPTASTIPNPESRSGPRASMSSADLVSAALSAGALRLGLTDFNSAAIPAACGAAAAES